MKTSKNVLFIIMLAVLFFSGCNSTEKVKVVEVPKLYQSIISKSSAGYDTRFSWEDMGEGNSYSVSVNYVDPRTSALNQVFSKTTTSSYLDMPTMDPGEYKWQLKRTSSSGKDSALSEIQTLELGVFKSKLDAEYQRPTKLKSLKDGGYLVLGYSHIIKLSETVNHDNGQWVVKVDDQGKVVWEYPLNIEISNNPPRSVTDAIELSDGSIALIGQDRDEKKVLVVKLNADGNLIWETLYSPNNIYNQYGFHHIIELNNQLIVTDRYSLQTIAAENGLVSEIIVTPIFNGIAIESISYLGVTKEGQLIIAGNALPPPPYPVTGQALYAYLDDKYGVYFQVLDSNYISLAAWHNVGEIKQLDPYNLYELPDNNFLVVSKNILATDTAIAVADMENSKAYYSFEAGTLDLEGENLELFFQFIFVKEGEIYAIATDGHELGTGTHQVIQQYNNKLVLVDQFVYSGIAGDVGIVDMVSNKDGTFTVLGLDKKLGAILYKKNLLK